MKANVATSVVRYVRDEKHNVSQMWIAQSGEPKPESWFEYTYDNHPNPFFKLGRDWGGDISVRSLSPFNLTKETYRNAAGVTSTITYTYEYLPNGYPKNVTILYNSANYLPWTQTLNFLY